jgi:hypothetical protein
VLFVSEKAVTRTSNNAYSLKAVKQNGREKVEAGVAVLEHLPKTIQAKKSADHGALDLDVPKPVCKADANHRVRAYSNALYKLVAMRNADSGGVTGVDRDQLKQNFCYALAKNVDKDFDQFKDAFELSIEHHSNNHTLCGEWCASKKVKLIWVNQPIIYIIVAREKTKKCMRR